MCDRVRSDGVKSDGVMMSCCDDVKGNNVGVRSEGVRSEE